MSYIEITIWDKDGGRRRERTKAENIKSIDARMNNIIRWLDVMKMNGNIAEFGVELYQE